MMQDFLTSFSPANAAATAILIVVAIGALKFAFDFGQWLGMLAVKTRLGEWLLRVLIG